MTIPLITIVGTVRTVDCCEIHYVRVKPGDVCSTCGAAFTTLMDGTAAPVVSKTTHHNR